MLHSIDIHARKQRHLDLQNIEPISKGKKKKERKKKEKEKRYRDELLKPVILSKILF